MPAIDFARRVPITSEAASIFASRPGEARGPLEPTLDRERARDVRQELAQIGRVEAEAEIERVADHAGGGEGGVPPHQAQVGDAHLLAAQLDSSVAAHGLAVDATRDPSQRDGTARSGVRHGALGRDHEVEVAVESRVDHSGAQIVAAQGQSPIDVGTPRHRAFAGDAAAQGAAVEALDARAARIAGDRELRVDRERRRGAG